MRWSLRTQVIVVLFAGYLLVLWEWREPWVYTGTVFDDELRFPVATNISPDKTRRLHQRNLSVVIFEESSSDQLYEIHYQVRGGSKIAFLHDDCLVARAPRIVRDVGLTPERFAVFTRRFPEWWWGHFYRPEVWLLPLWLGLIVWTIRKDRAVPK